MRSVFSFAFAHYHCFIFRGKNQIFLQSIGQSNSFTLYISFDSLTFNTCGCFARPIGVWKKYKLMLNHRVRDLSFFHLLKNLSAWFSTYILRPYLSVPFTFFPS